MNILRHNATHPHHSASAHQHNQQLTTKNQQQPQQQPPTPPQQQPSTIDNKCAVTTRTTTSATVASVTTAAIGNTKQKQPQLFHQAVSQNAPSPASGQLLAHRTGQSQQQQQLQQQISSHGIKLHNVSVAASGNSWSAIPPSGTKQQAWLDQSCERVSLLRLSREACLDHVRWQSGERHSDIDRWCGQKAPRSVS